MKLGLTLFAAALLVSPLTAHANPVTLNFTASGYEVPIASTGLNGSNLGTYTVQPGSCDPDPTICTWAGNYTSTNSNYLSGMFTISTTRADGETLTGIEDGVGADSLHITGASSDMTVIITINDDNTGTHTFYFIQNGTLDGALDITGFSSTGLYCNPSGSTCSISSIAAGGSFEGAPLANFSFDDGNTVATTPEPSAIALLGTGALGIASILRRRVHRA